MFAENPWVNIVIKLKVTKASPVISKYPKRKSKKKNKGIRKIIYYSNKLMMKTIYHLKIFFANFKNIKRISKDKY